MQQLLDDTAVENIRLEFKSEAPGKDETLKKLSSFANTFGGLMIVGAKANSADGRLEEIPGIEEVPGFKQRTVQWCAEGANPPLTVEISEPIPVPAGNGRVAYVVNAPESDVAPHFLNGRKGVWVRTDEYSTRFEARLADETELRHLLDRRKLIVARRTGLIERARSRVTTYNDRTPAASPAAQNRKGGPRLELSLVPRFPARPLCDQGTLAPLIMKNCLQYRGALFPDITRGIMSQHESALVLGARGDDLSVFECNIWGLLFYCAPIAHDHGREQGGWSVHPYRFASQILLFLHHAAKMLPLLGYSGPVQIETAITSMLRAPWLQIMHGVGLPREEPQLDDAVSFPIPTTMEALVENPDAIAMHILRYVFVAVNWPGLVDTQEKLENLVRLGYEFSSWPAAKLHTAAQAS